jgi:hypothetical protein
MICISIDKILGPLSSLYHSLCLSFILPFSLLPALFFYTSILTLVEPKYKVLKKTLISVEKQEGRKKFAPTRSPNDVSGVIWALLLLTPVLALRASSKCR